MRSNWDFIAGRPLVDGSTFHPINTSSVVNVIYEWTIKYPKAPKDLPRKGWILGEKYEFDVHIKVQLHDKLSMDLENVVASY